jgi:hypothetical protein
LKNRQTTDDSRQQQTSNDRNDREKKKNVSETIEESDRAIKLELDSEESKTKPNDGTDTPNKQTNMIQTFRKREVEEQEVAEH